MDELTLQYDTKLTLSDYGLYEVADASGYYDRTYDDEALVVAYSHDGTTWGISAIIPRAKGDEGWTEDDAREDRKRQWYIADWEADKRERTNAITKVYTMCELYELTHK